jgi:prepilin-type N-terminal cleavage/methylation domain-containing protein
MNVPRKTCFVKKRILRKDFVQEPRKAAGFTLVEVIVATAVFFILVNMAFVTMNTGMNSWFSSSTSVELRSELIKTLAAMERELKETAPAKLENLPSGGSAATLTFHLPQDVDGDGTLINWNGTAPKYEPIIEWSPTTVTYAVNGTGVLIRSTSLGQSRVVAQDIVGLQFSRPTTVSNILQIDLSAQKNDVKGRVLSDAARLMIKMRNN